MIIGSEKCELIALSPNSSRSKKFHDCSLQEKDTAKISKSVIATGGMPPAARRAAAVSVHRDYTSHPRVFPARSGFILFVCHPLAAAYHNADAGHRAGL
ncbi:hypothetical protein GSF67_15650 [Agrobacterium sp. CGMCC 11546]|nr:hypothetical protein GSF67_15650 [Agrobacterium sp. CGMCC 11546]